MTNQTTTNRKNELQIQQFLKEYYQGIQLILDDPNTQTQMKLYKIEAFTSNTKKRIDKCQ